MLLQRCTPRCKTRLQNRCTPRCCCHNPPTPTGAGCLRTSAERALQRLSRDRAPGFELPNGTSNSQLSYAGSEGVPIRGWFGPRSRAQPTPWFGPRSRARRDQSFKKGSGQYARPTTSGRIDRIRVVESNSVPRRDRMPSIRDPAPLPPRGQGASAQMRN